MRFPNHRVFTRLLAVLLLCPAAHGKDPRQGSELFTGAVPKIQIEVSEDGMKVLRDYVQVWRQPRPERIDVPATVREGGRIYTNVAIHLKGSYTFQPIDAKPSLTLNFGKLAKGQTFHGLTKIHLNNSVQDSSYLCEQLARELFAEAGVPCPRAGQAFVKLNGRNLGLCVLVEGANKTFVKQNFDSARGNLYDGGSGGDVTKALEADSGEHPENRSDLTNLVKAAREPDPTNRLARMENVLDVERFITFAAIEALLVHWDGYAIGCNNYRVFHDTSRGKMVFMPSGMDQLFGVSRSPTLPLTPVFKGMVAKALFSIPDGRRRYLERIEQLATNEFRLEALHARVDKLAARLRTALAAERAGVDDFDETVRALKARILQRTASVAQQLGNTRRPLSFTGDTPCSLAGWTFKGGPTQPALSSRRRSAEGEILCVSGRGAYSTGAWRTTVLLDEGHYEFTGRARTEGLTAAQLKGTNGMLLRISGDRLTDGIAISDEWRDLTYEFDVRGIEDIELVCEFRGPQQASGYFDPATMQLARKGPASNKPVVEVE